jgi:hypothetical protein
MHGYISRGNFADPSYIIIRPQQIRDDTIEIEENDGNIVQPRSDFKTKAQDVLGTEVLAFLNAKAKHVNFLRRRVVRHERNITRRRIFYASVPMMGYSTPMSISPSFSGP